MDGELRPLEPGQHSSIERIFSAFYRRIRKGSRRKLRSSSSEEDSGEEASDTALDMRLADGEGSGAGVPMPLTTDAGGGGGGGIGGGPASQVSAEERLPLAPAAAPATSECAGEGEGEGREGEHREGKDEEDEDEVEERESAPLPDFLTAAELQNQRVDPRNLRIFCDRLTEFVRYVQRVQGLARATYERPRAMQRRLERDLQELRSLLAAVRDAVATVQRLRAQRTAVRKDKAQLRKHLRKLREEEIREMESIVAVYDKAMFARWENVRHTHKADALHALLNDVKGKQQAMENLSMLIQRKQAQLQGQSPTGGSAAGGHGGDRERPSATALDAGSSADASALNATPTGSGASSPGVVAVATTAAAGPGTDAQSLPKRHAPAAGSARTVALRRRRHHERQQDAQSAAAAAMAAAVSRWDPELPLPLALPAPATGSPTVGSSEEGGGGPGPAVSSPSLNPSGCTSDDAEAGQAGANGSAVANTRAARAVTMGNPEFQNEMRGVLQALFGDLHLGPVANLEDIDLFAVRSSQGSNNRR